MTISRKSKHPGEVLLEDVIKPLGLIFRHYQKNIIRIYKWKIFLKHCNVNKNFGGNKNKSGKLVKYADKIRFMESFTKKTKEY